MKITIWANEDQKIRVIRNGETIQKVIYQHDNFSEDKEITEREAQKIYSESKNMRKIDEFNF